MRSPFVRGMAHGVPIMLGYLSVSFGFGIAAVRLGLSPAAAVAISALNLTSAGQAAGIEIIAAGGALVEMALTQLVINLRYALMGISLSQNLDSTFNTPRRLLVSYGITDEIYAVAVSRPEPLTAEEKKAWIATQTGVTVGSDAFFPFGDNVKRAYKSGVEYIVEPGGSIRDDNVIETANRYHMVMAFTGMRLFHH